MLNIVLVEPEIPQNTGNISRTCSVTGTALHLIRPLGFDISDSAVKRAGLDYWEYLDLHVYDSVDEFFCLNPACSFWLCSTKAPKCYSETVFKDGDFLIFGKETAGLPEALLRANPERSIRIPMLAGRRSLNLSNSAAIVLYEALRQLRFPGMETKSAYFA
ncbi:MAG: tRNA (cytidine(34)-2'-O)-methyltransferase [Clostridiales bacterium]|jgi:tRNA (cytidine/uridine-2'-O-)-methyltransferase|nr:tRNA (cytidine(34)-2'-O)-methyltransferase [Clostridiales bacterium]